jgi:hypothetical protein
MKLKRKNSIIQKDKKKIAIKRMKTKCEIRNKWEEKLKF